MTEVNYHLTDLSEAAVQGEHHHHHHHPPLTNHQQLRTPAQPDRKTLENMTGRLYAAITSTCSAEKTRLMFSQLP